MKATALAFALAVVGAAATAQTDLAVTGSVPPAFKIVARGSLAGVDVSVRNLGSATATNVRLNISLPASTTFNAFNLGSLPCSAPPPGSAGSISCTYASLAAGATAGGFRLFYSIPSTYPIDADASVIASVSSDTSDPDTGNNSVVLTTSVRGRADLVGSVQPSATQVKPLDEVSWTVHISNRGPDPSRDVSIQFDVSPEGTLVSATPSTGTCTIPNDVECSVGDIASGSSFDVTIATKAPSLQTTNWLGSASALSGLDVDPTPADRGGAAWVAVLLSGQADVSVALVPQSVIQPGSIVTVKLTVRNDGPDAAASPTLEVQVPISLLTFRQADGPQFSCYQVLPAITCTITSLEPGAAADFMMTLQTGPTPPFGTIDAWIVPVTTDPNQQNNSATLPLTSTRRRAVHR